jgi:hypothetical protein
VYVRLHKGYGGEKQDDFLIVLGSSSDMAGLHIDWIFPGIGRFTTVFSIAHLEPAPKRRILTIKSHGISKRSSTSKSVPQDVSDILLNGKDMALKTTNGFPPTKLQISSCPPLSFNITAYCLPSIFLALDQPALPVAHATH